MGRIPHIHEILGTDDGDRFLRHPSSANDLYRSLVGHPGRDSIQAALGIGPEPEAPWDVYGPDFIEPENLPATPVWVASQRAEEFFSSRDHCPGVGYPSCARALMRIPRKIGLDANGYYRLLGVRPDATEAEIRKALATKYRRTHPDTGWAPDTEEFMYLREIARVLLNPQRRERYDNLRSGEKWVDSRIRKKIEADNPIVMSMNAEDLSPFFKRVEQPDEEIINDLGRTDGRIGDGGVFAQDRSQAMRAADTASGNDHWDWFSEGEHYTDRLVAQLWYFHLMALALMFRYTRAIRVQLTNDRRPTWSDMGNIVRIPRFWKPTSGNSFALFTCVVASIAPGN